MAAMSKDSPNDCLICRKQRGEFIVPGGAIYLDDLVYCSHAHLTEDQPSIYLGWLTVETRRHIPGLADLTDAEGRAVGLWIARLSRALKEIINAEHIYAFVLGHGVPHLHIHLIPRYPGTPREYWGIRIDEWPEAPHGDARQVSTLCDQLRAFLRQEEAE
jgi:diadenosine tetraphosphate (Ap4A) HIT family hydrolase